MSFFYRIKVVSNLRDKGISPVYLVTDHVGFYSDMAGNSCVWCKGMMSRI